MLPRIVQASPKALAEAQGRKMQNDAVDLPLLKPDFKYVCMLSETN
jgi:hypothetical protein